MKLKRYQVEYIVPFLTTVISIYIWIKTFSISYAFISGLLINIIGLLVWWRGKIALGKNWQDAFKKPTIKNFITHGIYSKIRHPIYFGSSLTLIGAAVLIQNWIFAILTILIVFYFYIRLRMEDKYLLKELGDIYLKYKEKTWF